MSNMINEYELELELERELGGGNPESSEMHDAYGSREMEGELEAERYFRKIGRLASRRRKSPALRKVGARAARSVLAGLNAGINDDDDDIDDLDGEFETYELNPVRKVYSDAMLEHLGHSASMAENEDEAASRMLPLIPMVASKLGSVAMEGEAHKPAAHAAAPAAKRAVGNAVAKAVGHAVTKALGPAAGHAAAQTAARAAIHATTKVGHAIAHSAHHGTLAPKVHQTVMRAAPHLTKGIGHVTRTLYRNPQTRPLVRMVPAIARHTTADIARQVAHGHRVSPHRAVQTLARHTAHVLGSPKTLSHAWHHGRRLDHHVHGKLLPHHHHHGAHLHHHGHGVHPNEHRYGHPYGYRYGQGYTPQYGNGYAPHRPGYASGAAAGHAHHAQGQCGCCCPRCGK